MLPERPRTVLGLVRWPFFEIFFACVIVLNSLVTAAEIQYRGARFGQSMGWGGNGTSAWDGQDASEYELDSTFEHALTWLGWIFGVVFTMELVIKMAGERLQFFQS